MEVREKMERKQELEKIITYVVIEGMFYNDVNFNLLRSLLKENLALSNTDNRDINKFITSALNEIITKIRHNVITTILKKEAKGELIDNLFSFAKKIVIRRVVDETRSAKSEKKKHKPLLQKQESLEDTGDIPVDSASFDVAASIELKKIVMDCIRFFEKVLPEIITRFYFDHEPLGQIAEIMGKDLERVKEEKNIAVEIMRLYLKKRLGPNAKEDLLYDISMLEEYIKEHSEVITSKAGDEKIHYPEISEEIRAYIDMLLHTLNKVVKILPISDMMDEYLYGRLEGDQKVLFEKHLLECKECFMKFKERRTLVSAISSVLKDLE